MEGEVVGASHAGLLMWVRQGSALARLPHYSPHTGGLVGFEAFCERRDRL